MVFYKVESKRDMPEKENEMSTREKRAICSCLAERSDNFYHKCAGECFIATVAIRDESATFTVIAKTTDIVKSQFENYVAEPVFQITSYKIEEITFSSFSSLLTSSLRNSFIVNDDDDFNIIIM